MPQQYRFVTLLLIRLATLTNSRTGKIDVFVNRTHIKTITNSNELLKNVNFTLQ